MMAPVIVFGDGLDFAPDEVSIFDFGRALDEIKHSLGVCMSAVFEISISGLLIHHFYGLSLTFSS